MEQRYSILRKHLGELGYEQALTIEAVPLVERLLADLVKTTESLYHYKNVAQSAIEERDQLQLGAEPYKCDNAKLVKECNDLHLAFLQYREQTDKAQRELKLKIHALEMENEDHSRHLEDVQKLGDRSSKSNNLRRRTIPSKISITRHSASTAETPMTVKSDKPKEKHNCDCGTYEQQNSCLRHEIKKLKLDLIKMNDTTECLKNKLSSRDREIQRLCRSLEGGRPLNALNKDCCYKDMCSKLRNVTEENCRLGNERNELDIQLNEAITKQHEAMKRALQLADRNKELERELRDIDQMALAVEEECNTAVKKNCCKVSKAQEQLQNCHCKIENLELEVKELRCVKQGLESELKEFRDEKENLHKILENTMDDKKRMTDRLNQFTRIEHDLNLEIDRLMQTCTLQKRKIADLEYQLTKTSDNDAEMDADKRKRTVPGSQKCPKCLKCNYPRRTKAGPYDQGDEEVVDKLKGERDYYRQECERLCQEVNNVAQDSAASSAIKRRLTVKEDEVARLEKEIQESTREKHNLMLKLESTQGWCKDGDNSSLKSVLSRVEKERDLARGDVRRLEEERDSLRKRLKSTTETHVTERDRLQKIMSDSEEKLRKLEVERREIMTVQGSRRATINNLEEQVESLTAQLRTTQSELDHIHTLYSQIKTLQEQTDRALADTQGQLTQVEVEYAHAQERVRELETDRSELDKELSVLKNDLYVMKGNLTKIDSQRDNLLIEVDNKTERIALLEQELKSKDNKLVISDTTVAELRQQLNLYNDEAAAKEYQLKNSTTELGTLRRELDDANQSKKQAVCECRRLQNELAKVNLDLRNTTNDLERGQRQVADLKTQLQQYVYEVKRAEDQISKKENERTDMLDQFRSLSQEASVLETSNHTLETKALEVKNQLSSAQDHILDLECKVEQLTTLNNGYEKQISQLSSQIACLETQIRQHAGSNSKIEMDLAAMKELCCKLDGQKDVLMQELKEKDDNRSRLEREKERMKLEVNKLRDSLDQEHSNIGSIESLLSQSRQEAVEQRLMNQELQTEIQRLKNMVEDLQSKLTVTSQQLDVFQDKALDYSQQLKQLRREVANERFRAHSGNLSSRYPSL